MRQRFASREPAPRHTSAEVPSAPSNGAPLRVLLVAEQLRLAAPGGIGTYTTGLVQGLAALPDSCGIDLSLVASRVSGEDPLAALGRPVTSVALGSRLLVKAWDVGALPAGRGFAVLHASSTMVPRAHVPTVATVHDLAWRDVPQAYPRRGRRWHEAALHRAARRAAFLVVPSEEVADALRELVSDPDRVVVIEEGADHLPPPDHAAARGVLARLGVAGDFLLAVGTLEPRKNLGRLVEAFLRARAALPGPWPLVVVGPSGWGNAGIPAPGGAGRGVGGGVVLAGKVSGAVLSGLYASCRCLAYVPITEGYGLPVVEAMRAGAPVVASWVPSARGAALEVDPLEVASIADGLLMASVDGARRTALIAAGLERTAGLTWAATASKHVALWRRAAS